MLSRFICLLFETNQSVTSINLASQTASPSCFCESRLLACLPIMFLFSFLKIMVHHNGLAAGTVTATSNGAGRVEVRNPKCELFFTSNYVGGVVRINDFWAATIRDESSKSLDEGVSVHRIKHLEVDRPGKKVR